MKEHNYQEKHLDKLFKQLEKEYPEIKAIEGERTLQKVLAAVKKSNKLEAFQNALIDKMEQKQAQGFWRQGSGR